MYCEGTTTGSADFSERGWGTDKKKKPNCKGQIVEDPLMSWVA